MAETLSRTISVTSGGLKHKFARDREKGQAPHEIGRAQFGRISIANTDSEAIALMDAAFDAAWRAVEEQTAGT